MGVPALALSVPPPSFTAPAIVPVPDKSRILSATSRTSALLLALLKVPAPPIERVCDPTLRSPPV